jgi:hypothetical protein
MQPTTVAFQVSIILLNLLTAVIVEVFDKMNEQAGWRVSPSDLEGAPL